MPVLRLDDGRALAYESWGPPDGRPLVMLHGSPGSRLCVPDADAASAAGFRLVTFDRPGYGGSDPREGRTLLDTAGDVADLVDALGLERCSVLGVSGGGPHALACAAALGARVEALGLVACAGPLDEVPGAWDRLGEHMRPTAEVARSDPARARRAVCRYMQGWVDDPESYVGPGGPAPDRAVKTDPRWRPLLVAEAREALRQGALGLADDQIAFWRPWGFSVGDVPAGARLWHGAHDSRARPDFDWLARALPAATAEVWPDAGHLAVVTRWSDVLAGLQQS